MWLFKNQKGTSKRSHYREVNMPIRPIDMQVLLPKAIKIDSARPGVVNRIENALTAAQSEQQQDLIKQQTQVNTLQQKDNARIKRELEQDEQKKKKKREQQNATQSDDPEKGNHLDLKV